MAHVFKITDGTVPNTIDLAASTYRVINYRMRGQGAKTVMHSSDAADNGPEPVRQTHENRVWELTLQISGSSRNVLANAFTALERVLLSASAGRMDSPYAQYYLEIQQDSATNWTRYAIKKANITDSSGYYGVLSMRSGVTAPVAWPVVVTIETEPRGYGNTESLKNICRNASIQVDSNSDGLADFWEPYTAVMGAETYAINTTYYLAGGTSQKVIALATDTVDRGIRSIRYPITGGQDCAARVCIYVVAGGELVYIGLMGSTGAAIEATNTGAAADSTETDATGASWKVYNLSGTSAGGDTYVYLYAYVAGDVANVETTFYVDRVYLRVDNSATLPAAWSSRYIIENHQDLGYELVLNGYFEDVAGTNWASWTESVSDGAIADGGAGRAGGGGANLSHPVLTCGVALMLTQVGQLNMVVVPLEPYTLEFWTKGDGVNAGRYMVYDNDHAAALAGLASTGVTADTWTRLRVPFIPPAGCDDITISFLCPQVNGAHAHFDDASILAPSHVNYIEVAKVPGDQPALARYYNETAGAWGTYPMYLYLGNHDDDPGRASNYLAQYSTAGTTDRRYDVTAAIPITTWTNVGQIVLNAAPQRGEYLLLALINSRSATPCLLRAKVTWGSSALDLSTYYYTEPVTIADNQVWTLEALGPINMMWPALMESGLVTLNLVVDLEAYHADAATDFWTDQLHLFPLHGDLSISALDAVNGNDAEIILDRMNERDGSLCAVEEPAATMRMLKPPIQGEHPLLRAGAHQRLHFLARQRTAGGDYHSVNYTGLSLGAWTITYRPRTSTLLGTT